MAKFYVKGTALTTLEETTKKGKNAKGKAFEKKGIFVTIKNPVMCDKHGNPLDEDSVSKICDTIADELDSFCPSWAIHDFKDTDGQPIQYLNLSSQYLPNLYVLEDGKARKVSKEDVYVNNAEVICFCNNTYHNSILVLTEGHDSASPFDEDFNI